MRRVLISAVVWNDKVKSDATLVGRTVILSHFALNEYRNSLSLSSKIRSTIQPAAKHPYIQYEQQVIS